MLLYNLLFPLASAYMHVEIYALIIVTGTLKTLFLSNGAFMQSIFKKS